MLNVKYWKVSLGIPHYKFRLGKVIRKLALTGEAIDVQEAKEIGLVDKAKGGEGKRGNG